MVPIDGKDEDRGKGFFQQFPNDNVIILTFNRSKQLCKMVKRDKSKGAKKPADEVLFPSGWLKIDPEVPSYAYGTPEAYAIAS